MFTVAWSGISNQLSEQSTDLHDSEIFLYPSVDYSYTSFSISNLICNKLTVKQLRLVGKLGVEGQQRCTLQANIKILGLQT